jgi:cytoskeletal protein CcmA (bactofilin family)/transcription elongation factor Elf1
MPTTPPKTPFRCPVCGFVQLESTSLVSTNCRSCGAHYEVTAQDKIRVGGETALPTFAGKKSAEGRTVHCLKCGRSHDVSRKAQSTICPGCYAPIELIDVAVNESISRAVDTRGHLKLGPKGNIGNDWIVCGSARIEGVFKGHLRCEGEARLAMQKPFSGRITAGSVLVEKKARIECPNPIEADSFAIEGTMCGKVISRGIVRVLKGGVLEGEVEAPALVVEKGGIHVGSCRIHPPRSPISTTEIEASSENSGVSEPVQSAETETESPTAP